MARSAARPRFQGRSSAGWKTPPPDPSQPTPPPDDAADQDAPPSPSFGDSPIDANPLMAPDVLRFVATEYAPMGAITNLGDPINLMESSLGGDRVAALQMAPVDEKAIDLLWDWARADPDAIRHFLGFVPEHSRALFKWMENFNAVAAKGMAWQKAVYLGGQLIGFVALIPVTKTPLGALTGDCHIYLAKPMRGNISALLPLLMAEADRLIPNVSLRVVTARDDEWVRLLRGVGFTTQIVLTRPAAGSTGG